MDVNIDSRTIQPGQIFIPIKGDNFDGRDFIPDVLSKGARVLDVDLWDYAKKYRKKLNCAVIGITGSAGKTTTKDMLTAILSKKFKVVSTQDNQNNEIGTPLTILRADADTEILIVEMGMCHKGDIKKLTQLVRPTHSIITNIGVTHIELMGTQRNIAFGKAEIFQPALKWESESRMAFLNHQTPYYDVLTNQAEKANYSIHPFGGDTGLDQTLNLCRLVGRHFGLTDDEIRQGIEALETSPHRMKVSQVGDVTVIDDTYNANPNGVAYALQKLATYRGRRILVLADMLELGHLSKKEHQCVVERAIDADVSLIFTYGPETAHMKSKDIYIMHFDDKAELHKQLLMELKKNDVVLVKGSRSMKMEETVAEIEGNYA